MCRPSSALKQLSKGLNELPISINSSFVSTFTWSANASHNLAFCHFQPSSPAHPSKLSKCCSFSICSAMTARRIVCKQLLTRNISLWSLLIIATLLPALCLRQDIAHLCLRPCVALEPLTYPAARTHALLCSLKLFKPAKTFPPIL